MTIDFDKNAKYYKSDEFLPCDCEICKLYYQKVKTNYPEITRYLESINVDILRPFELLWVENEQNDQIKFSNCQYIVFGDCEDDFKEHIGNITLEKSFLHPSTSNIQGEHFVLEFGDIILSTDKID